MTTPNFTALAAKAAIGLTAELDDIPVRGNALASGDDDADRECEDAILTRLEAGDVWAWAIVVVTATLDGFTGSDCLGACSYADEESFREPDGYFDDLVNGARLDLEQKLEHAWKTLQEAR